jgi:hypothetical protein
MVSPGDIEDLTVKLNDITGPIVRNAPNALIFNSDTAYTSVYGVRANVRKVDSYGAASASRYRPNTLTAIKKDDVNWFRRQHLHFLSEQGISRLEDRLLERVQKLTDLLGVRESEDTQPDCLNEHDDGWSSSKDMDTMSKWLAFDVITDLCLGETANLLESPTNRSYIKGITAAGRGSLIVRAVPSSHALVTAYVG